MAVSTVFDLTAADKALKELYAGQVVENLVYKNNPFLALVPKFTEFGGRNYPQPVIYGNSQGRSALFANAQANQTAAQVTQFLLTRATDYSIATLDNQTMLASKTDKMAFLEAAKLVVDGAIQVITNSLAASLFRTGTGSIGQINASGLSTGIITLMNAGDVVNFELNQTLNCSNGTTDGNAVRAAKGYVIAIDRTAGTVTVASSALGGTAATPSAWAASEYLCVDGDLNAKIKGLGAWLPTTAPTSTTFFGVDRSVDVVRLGGVRYDGSGQDIPEALIDASMLVAREGGTPDHCLVSFASYAALEKALGAKVQYVDLNGPAGVSFKGIRIHGANTEIKVVPDRSCPAKTAFLVQMDTWKLRSLGDAPQILRYGDGLEMLRVYNADSSELRCAYYAQLACNAPGWNANVSLST